MTWLRRAYDPEIPLMLRVLLSLKLGLLAALLLMTVYLVTVSGAGKPKPSYDVRQPRLALSYAPRLPLANGATGGGAIVTFTAEVVGGMTEEWYCPRVTWEVDGLTPHSEEGDCDPWESTTCFDRRWRETVLLGETEPERPHRVSVTLSKDGRRLATEEAEVEVR